MQASLPTDGFIGRAILSQAQPGVSYRLERRLGVGGTAAAYLATRATTDSESPAVVKIILPDVLMGHGSTAEMVVRKEAVALGRLNERIPPTPFVVRLMDVGALAFTWRNSELALPWLAIEFVNGGMEGTTLEERLARSIDLTGAAFDRERAARVIAHMCAGLSEVHSVGVIHRDLTPNNVLCCGFGDAEVFKLSDFGIARPAGLSDTFGPSVIGTPGYICPEQVSEATSGPSGDIFSLGCLIFFVLTGEHLFDVQNVVEMMTQLARPERTSIRTAPALAPDLRSDPDACETIDSWIARATALDPTRRPATPRELAAGLVPLLLERATLGSRKRRATLMSEKLAPALPELTWVVRHPPGDDRIVHSVGWDGDGHCLAATTQGLLYWNGSEWQRAPARDLPIERGLRFVKRIGPGRWLVGGEEALLAEYSQSGVSRVMRGKDASTSFLDASGNVADLAVVVGSRRGAPPELIAAAGGHWLRPLPVPEAAYISGLAPVDEERWLVVGRKAQGGGFLALYSPLAWTLETLEGPATRAWVACAARPEHDLVVAVGTEGSILRVERGSVGGKYVPEQPNLSSISVDVLDREWAGGTSELWCSIGGKNWTRVFQDRSWDKPFVSVFADLAWVVAMTVDGGVLECRQTGGPGRSTRSSSPARH